MTKPTGDSFDDLTAALLERAPNISHNVSHGTADAIEVAGFVGLLAAHLHEVDERCRSLGQQLARRSNGADLPDEIEASRAAERAETRAARAAGPRHKFGPAGTCVAVHGTDGAVCGKPKGKPGRPPAPVELAPPALPGMVSGGAAAADKYLDGGQGSSSMRR